MSFVKRKKCGAVDEAFSGELAPALLTPIWIYIALPIAADNRSASGNRALRSSSCPRTDACSTKVPLAQAADELFPGEKGASSLAAIPWPASELPGIAHAPPPNFSAKTPRAPCRQIFRTLAAGPSTPSFLPPHRNCRPGSTNPVPSSKSRKKSAPRPLWLGARNMITYAVGPGFPSPATRRRRFSRDSSTTVSTKTAFPSRLQPRPSAIASPSPSAPFSHLRDIVLTNQEVLSRRPDLFVPRLDDLREKLAPATRSHATPPTELYNSSARSKHFFHTSVFPAPRRMK